MTRDEKIFKLGKIITDRKEILLGLEKMSTEAPEYRGIDCGLQYAERRYGKQVADDCLDLALKMGKRKPKTFAQLKALSGIEDDSNTTETACTHVLYCIGQKPDYKELLAGTKVELSPRGLMICDPVTLQT